MFYSQKDLWGGGKLPPGKSQLPEKIEPKFQRLTPFSRTAIPMALTGLLPYLTGNGKLVAAIKWLAEEIEGQFQGLTYSVFQMSGHPQTKVVII